MTVLLVAAALGAAARALVGLAVPGARGTLAVNLAGSLLLGLLVGAGTSSYAVVGVAFCGAFTTFSTWAVEVVEGAGWRYAVSSTLLCCVAAALGLRLNS